MKTYHFVTFHQNQYYSYSKVRILKKDKKYLYSIFGSSAPGKMLRIKGLVVAQAIRTVIHSFASEGKRPIFGINTSAITIIIFVEMQAICRHFPDLCT